MQSNRDHDRVVITGFGAISPNGNNSNEIWKNLSNGLSGIDVTKKITKFSSRPWICGEIKSFSFDSFFSSKELRRLDRYTQLILIACDEAITMSGWDLQAIDLQKVGIFVGTSLGAIGTIQNTIASPRKNIVSPLFTTSIMSNSACCEIGLKYQITGPSFAPIAACSTGNYSIGIGFNAIKNGGIDAAIVGAGEAPLSEIIFQSCDRLKVLSRNFTNPAKASCPFSLDRDGFVLSEGAAILVLERLSTALLNNHQVFAEVIGCEMSTDSFHLTSPNPSGRPIASLIQSLLHKIGVNREYIDYINCHGTSTVLNDLAETRGIQLAFQESTKSLDLSSTKSMTGHLLGASSALEAILCVHSIRNSFILPTINLENPDPNCNLNYTPNTGISKNISIAISNSFGFGGHNSALCLAKFKEK